jgi:hypothetical protein
MFDADMTAKVVDVFSVFNGELFLQLKEKACRELLKESIPNLNPSKRQVVVMTLLNARPVPQHRMYQTHNTMPHSKLNWCRQTC